MQRGPGQTARSPGDAHTGRPRPGLGGGDAGAGGTQAPKAGETGSNQHWNLTSGVGVSSDLTRGAAVSAVGSSLLKVSRARPRVTRPGGRGPRLLPRGHRCSAWPLPQHTSPRVFRPSGVPGTAQDSLPEPLGPGPCSLPLLTLFPVRGGGQPSPAGAWPGVLSSGSWLSPASTARHRGPPALPLSLRRQQKPLPPLCIPHGVGSPRDAFLLGTWKVVLVRLIQPRQGPALTFPALLSTRRQRSDLKSQSLSMSPTPTSS